MAFAIDKLPYNPKNSTNVFEFEFRNYVTILFGYPDWKAFVSTDKKILWIEVYPEINIFHEKIVFPEDVPYDCIDRIVGETGRQNEPEFSPSSDEIKLRLKKEKSFFLNIPTEIKELCKNFSSKHWEIIKVITVLGNNFIKLINSNPSMAFLLVNLDKLEPKYGLRYQHILLNHTILRKQKEILRMAGFPSTESMRNIFMKTDSRFLTGEKLILFRYLLKRSPFKQFIKQSLEQSKYINEKVFDFISIKEGGLSSTIPGNMINKVLESERKDEIITKIRQYYESSMKINGEIIPINKVINIDSLINKLNVRIQKLSNGKYSIFPEPPLSDNKYIQALYTPKAQIAWSKQQNNCIRQYVDNVKYGRTYFYKIRFNNEEATLEIKISREEIYMGDLLGMNNKKVSEELKIMVKDWYENQVEMKKINTLD